MRYLGRDLPRTRQDGGFTLVELLVTITIMGIITVPLGNAMIGFLRNTDATTRRLSESHDAQISAAYFAQDVASIGVRSTTTPYPLLQSIATPAEPTALVCGSTGTTVVRFGWDDPTSATAASEVRVAYVIQTVAGERQLHRLVCVNGSSTPSKDIVLAHNVDTTAPTVACASPTSCIGTGTSVPKSVTMVLSLRHAANPGAAYTVTLTGLRRQTA